MLICTDKGVTAATVSYHKTGKTPFLPPTIFVEGGDKAPSASCLYLTNSTGASAVNDAKHTARCLSLTGDVQALLSRSSTTPIDGRTQRQAPLPTPDSGLGSICEIIAPDSKWWLQDTAAKLLPGSRTSTCLRCRTGVAGGGDLVAVREYTDAHGRRGAGYDLQTCGSVWNCPICSVRIANERRKELKLAIAYAKSQGIRPYLLTLTVRHSREHSLGYLLDCLGKSWDKFLKRKAWKAAHNFIGIQGYVRALEVKHGENGWHPHLHILLFANGEGEPQQADLQKLWQDVCKASGISAGSSGLDIRAGDDAVSAYVTKVWDLTDELTQGAEKSVSGGETPWQILRQAGEGSKYHADLWREYAQTMKGRRQLRWSKGLRDLLCLEDESTPEMLTEQVQVVAVHHIPLEAWHAVVKAGARGRLLSVVVEYGWHTAERYIRALTASAGGIPLPDKT